jgi:hypothetical protein
MRFALVFGLALTVVPIAARANEVGRPMPIERACSVPADPEWTTPEKFVWQHVCIGDVADFNAGSDYGGDLDPKRAEGLPESRILRPAFLETILLDKKYRNALTRLGVQIVGARFADTVDLRNAQLRHDVILRRCLLDRGANLVGMRSGYTIELSDCKVGATLDMGRLQVNQLSLRGSNVTGDLGMFGLRVEQTLYMQDAELRGVDLGDGRIGKGFSLTGSNVTGILDMAGLEVGSNVLLGRGAQYSKIIDFFYGKVGGNLDLAGGTFHDQVDLSGTQIGGLLRLGSESRGSAHWPGSPALTLRNAKAGALQDFQKDSQNSWPDKLDLSGFVYRSFDGNLPTEPDSKLGRGADWFEAWLMKQKHYSPEPYQQLAAVLRNQGQLGIADEILYAGKKRETETALPWRWVELTASKLFIGYGYYLFRSLYWALGFLVLGSALLWLSGEGRRISRHYNFLYGVVYSFDLLIPIIKLHDKHYDIDLNGWIRYYFYFHKMMGYVLAGFLAAGLTGLTTLSPR